MPSAGAALGCAASNCALSPLLPRLCKRACAPAASSEPRTGSTGVAVAGPGDSEGVGELAVCKEVVDCHRRGMANGSCGAGSLGSGRCVNGTALTDLATLQHHPGDLQLHTCMHMGTFPSGQPCRTMHFMHATHLSLTPLAFSSSWLSLCGASARFADTPFSGAVGLRSLRLYPSNEPSWLTTSSAEHGNDVYIASWAAKTGSVGVVETCPYLAASSSAGRAPSAM